MSLGAQRYVRCHSRPFPEADYPCFITPGSAYRLIKTVTSAVTGDWHQILADDGKERNYQAKHFEAPFTCIDGERTPQLIAKGDESSEAAA